MTNTVCNDFLYFVCEYVCLFICIWEGGGHGFKLKRRKKIFNILMHTFITKTKLQDNTRIKGKLQCLIFTIYVSKVLNFLLVYCIYIFYYKIFKCFKKDSQFLNVKIYKQ